ncbi:hypothetical protein MRX96_014285 [Rhipicephalus microplus]
MRTSSSRSDAYHDVVVAAQRAELADFLLVPFVITPPALLFLDPRLDYLAGGWCFASPRQPPRKVSRLGGMPLPRANVGGDPLGEAVFLAPSASLVMPADIPVLGLLLFDEEGRAARPLLVPCLPAGIGRALQAGSVSGPTSAC